MQALAGFRYLRSSVVVSLPRWSLLGAILGLFSLSHDLEDLVEDHSQL